MKKLKLKKDEIIVNNIVMRKYNIGGWRDIRVYNNEMPTFKELLIGYNKIFREPYRSDDVNWELFDDYLSDRVDLKYAEAGCDFEYVYLDGIVTGNNRGTMGYMQLFINKLYTLNKKKFNRSSYKDWLNSRFVYRKDKSCRMEWIPSTNTWQWIELKNQEDTKPGAVFDTLHWNSTEHGVNATPTEKEECRYILDRMKDCAHCSIYRSCLNRFPFPQSSHSTSNEYLGDIEKIYRWYCDKYRPYCIIDSSTDVEPIFFDHFSAATASQ